MRTLVSIEVQDLAKNEDKGVDFVAHYLLTLRQTEVERQTTDVAKLNGYKGHIPSETRPGVKLIVANDSQFKKLTHLGYTRVGDYVGSGQENGVRGYYYSTVAGNKTYQQGVLQTVQTSAMGVDPRTGASLNGATGGTVDPTSVADIRKHLKLARKQGRVGVKRTMREPQTPESRTSNEQTLTCDI